MLHAPLCHGLDFFLVFVYPIVTVFSSQVLDTNTSSCVASSALYTLTRIGPSSRLKSLVTVDAEGAMEYSQYVPFPSLSF